MTFKKTITCLLLLLTGLTVHAQRFFNLTAEEVKLDTLLPAFHYAYPLGDNFADSTYTIEIAYPEFLPMSQADVLRYQQLSGRPLGQLPEIVQSLSVSRKQGTLHIGFVPLVCRDGRYQKLVSFMLKVKGHAKQQTMRARRAGGERYAANSVLAAGTWAKIRVPASGTYQLTEALIRKAGFSDINKVKVYGYGGALQPERLTGDYLAATDDVKEVPTCTVNGIYSI